jgi:AcrR family transcriptional regulator
MSPKKRKPSPRVQKKRKQMRLEILAAARDILLQDGPDGVTLNAVSGRLDMTKPALYHYFESKEALARSLVTTLIDEEIDALLRAVGEVESTDRLLGAMIRAFHAHYAGRLHAFRFVYGQSQLYTTPEFGMDADMIRDEITPRTRRLFDVLESRLADSALPAERRRSLRRLAFVAWTSALGLVTMLGIADATRDPLVHSDEVLVDALAQAFDARVVDQLENSASR